MPVIALSSFIFLSAALALSVQYNALVNVVQIVGPQYGVVKYLYTNRYERVLIVGTQATRSRLINQQAIEYLKHNTPTTNEYVHLVSYGHDGLKRNIADLKVL